MLLLSRIERASLREVHLWRSRSGECEEYLVVSLFSTIIVLCQFLLRTNVDRIDILEQ